MLVHEHDKIAIARHIHQNTPHSALGKSLQHLFHPKKHSMISRKRLGEAKFVSKKNTSMLKVK